MSPIERSGGGGGGATAALASGRTSLTTGDFTWSATTFTDINAALDITITTGAHRCLVSWLLIVTNDHSPTPQLQTDVQIDGALQGGAFGLSFQGSPTGGSNFILNGSYLTAVLTAASHTFKLMFRLDANLGTSTIRASNTIAPVTFSVVELYA